MPFTRSVLLAAMLKGVVAGRQWFAPNYKAHVISNLDDGLHRFEYDVIVRAAQQYKSGNITGDCDFPPTLISDTLTNRSSLVDAKGECSVYFFDGIPFDASPWDGILQMFQAETETAAGIFAFAGQAQVRGFVADVYQLREPFSASSLSTYWEASIYMDAGAPRMLRSTVKGSGMDGANHSLTEDYVDWSHEEPAAEIFAIPEQCGACLNCDGVPSGSSALV